MDIKWLLILIAIIIIAVYCFIKIDRSCNKSGGYIPLPIPSLDLLPTKIEYIDDITGEKRSWFTNKKIYASPNSNIQIQNIIKYGNTNEYGRLIQLIGKFYKRPAYEIPKFIAHKKDSEIYSYLKQNYPRHDVNKVNRDKFHAETTFRVIKDFLSNQPDTELRNTKYLDLGCNTGIMTYELGKLLKAEEIHGTDVLDNIPTKEIIYKRVLNDGRLDYDDNTFDFISAHMTLHHIEDVETCSKEIFRILKPGGYLFIREHDCWTAIDAMLIDVEHELYANVGSDEGDYKIYRYTNYYGWDTILSPLKYLGANYYYMKLREDISPTRAYWAIYKK